MTRSQLLDLIANGENSTVEFKRDDIHQESLAKEIVAFANLGGGRVLLGVEDDGSISGIQRLDLERWVMATVFGQYVHPMILPLYEEVQLENRKRVAIITVGQGTTKPYVVRRRGREDIYIRVGSTSQLASREQQARLFSLGGILDAEALPVSGTSLIDLDKNRLADYLLSVVQDDGLPKSEEAWSNRLCGLGFMVSHESGMPLCTIAGLLLFGFRPRRFLRHAGVRWMAFDGNEMSYRALDDRVLDGPLVGLRSTGKGSREVLEFGLVEQLVSAMIPFISTEAATVGESMRRERRWIYPVSAVREALINAFAHRDWTRREEIEICRYSNRLEVLSPGALRNSMTVEKMIAGQRSPRNHLIVEVLRDYKYGDARGMGVRRTIIPLLREQNGTEPEFMATDDFLRVVMHARPSDGASDP